MSNRWDEVATCLAMRGLSVTVTEKLNPNNCRPVATESITKVLSDERVIEIREFWDQGKWAGWFGSVVGDHGKRERFLRRTTNRAAVVQWATEIAAAPERVLTS